MRVKVCDKNDKLYMWEGDLVEADAILHKPAYHHAIDFGIEVQGPIGYNGAAFKPVITTKFVLTVDI